MVQMVRFYFCEKCRKQFVAYETARNCEMAHVVDAAVERARAEIAECFRQRDLKYSGREPTPLSGIARCADGS